MVVGSRDSGFGVHPRPMSHMHVVLFVEWSGLEGCRRQFSYCILVDERGIVHTVTLYTLPECQRLVPGRVRVPLFPLATRSASALRYPWRHRSLPFAHHRAKFTLWAKTLAN